MGDVAAGVMVVFVALVGVQVVGLSPVCLVKNSRPVVSKWSRNRHPLFPFPMSSQDCVSMIEYRAHV